ncbi:MAG: hypothetical protein FWD09_04700 [Lentimicrobiaceae bacterium]|nr:hypothetical protein [Lentimicrobiaceae bacterium]
MNEDQNFTWDDIKRMFAETRQQIKETSQQMKETDQRLDKMFAETDRQMKETDRQMKETNQKLDKMFAETDRQMKETDRQMKETDRQMKETDKKIDKRFAKLTQAMKKLDKHLGGIGKNNGDMAEEYFFSAFRKDKIFMNEKYDRIQKGFFYSFECPIGEFDIVLFNGKSVAIIEVKYKARPDNVSSEELISRIERFKKYVPEYKNHNIYLGVAAMSFKSGLASKLHKAGIATIHPVGKKMMIYDKDVKVF